MAKLTQPVAPAMVGVHLSMTEYHSKMVWGRTMNLTILIIRTNLSNGGRRTISDLFRKENGTIVAKNKIPPPLTSFTKLDGN